MKCRTSGGEMPDVQVTCINKQPRDNSHEGITHLGGDGWKWPRSEVIQSIENGTNTFFTLVSGKRADVGVVSGPNGKYVRTHADGYYNDNLLALPECP
ncbi:DUF3892 domain-containing protein [Bradyrhizobium japonicum]|uniref:DUF3892 domain-containing protein n=2 Tax=Bradyrhizobium japonicum TaxID=375 RepID=UPI0034E46AA8